MFIRNWQTSSQTLTKHFSIFYPRNAASKERHKKIVKYNDGDAKIEEVLNANFLYSTIGASYSRWTSVLEKYPELKALKRRDVENTTEMLRSLNYASADIVSKPMILYYNSLTLNNRYKVLRECGFELISISLLSKYVTVMNKSVTLLKSHGYISIEKNVPAELKACFCDINLKISSSTICSDNQELKNMRQQILNCYLRQRLDMNTANLEKVWKCYSRVRHKSFNSIRRMIKILLEELNFSKERIVKNAFLLHGDADNVQRIVNEVQTIDGQDVRVIAYRRPKILMSSCDALLKTLAHVKSFGIGEDAVLRCLEILTLGPDTVLERLQELRDIEEFEVLGSNPRILRLVHYQNKARLRLEYLNQLKVRCASLHILSCGSDAFAKFARDGSDRTKGRDIVVYLSNVMGKQEILLRNLFSRHPNWCHIPALHVKQCYDYLIRKKFSVEDIYQNIHLLIYPIKRIEEKLLQLQHPEFLEEIHLVGSFYDLSSKEILTLILYLIECEYHFTGDGIWTDQHTQQVENFNNLLPDFPESLNKVYKYGVKPVNQNPTDKMQLEATRIITTNCALLEKVAKATCINLF